ncbi:MAG: alpha/beta fold hydrolase [Woeseiaceae bacterium]|nr:alpha/beta fold hydrolase [Woeseiaceae bacterium]
MRRLAWTGAALAIVVIVLWLLTPPTLGAAPSAIELPSDLDAWLEETERDADSLYGLVPGSEKRIRWQQQGTRTPIAVVNLHGFSATRQELAPLPDIVADALGANLFETRLTGHGRETTRLEDVQAEDWIADAREALAIGETIGERIVLIGNSTGATLALAMLGDEAMRNVDAIILVSPNIAPADPAAQWITRPGGPILLRLMAGDSISWEPLNEQQEIYWTTTYPSEATVQVMRLADRAKALLSRPFEQEVLMLVAPGDQVVSPDAALEAFEAIQSPRKQLIEFTDSEDPKHHILAGDIVSPGTTGIVAELIVDFLQGAD